MSLILIEGVDRTGKSSLAESLRELTDACVLHFSSPKSDNPLVEYVWPLRGYDGGESIVCDRGHLGEVVWPRFFGRESILSENERRWIELWLVSRGALSVHTRRSLQGIEAAFREADPPEPLPVERVPEAVEAYRDAYAEVATPVMAYDHQQRSWMVRAVAEEAARLADFVRPGLAITDLWIGAHRPRTLVVTRAADPWTVAAPDGDAFARAMEAVGPRWPLLAFCALEHPETGRRTPLRDLWNYLGRPDTFAAEPDAVEAIQEAGIGLPGHRIEEEEE